MEIHYGFDNTEHIRNAVITTGSFDGVHIGHRAIIQHINSLAKNSGGVSVLITFWPHPRKVLYPETTGKELQLINTQREKIKLLEKTGLDHLIIVPFTLEFAQTSSTDFVEKILLQKLHASTIIVGFNHHFGRNREGDYKILLGLSQKYNFKVEEIPEQAIQNETVSSTKIREAIMNGNMQKANAYLDEIYCVIGKKIETLTISVNLPLLFRIEIEEDVKLLPPEGFYAGQTITKSHKKKCLIIITRNKDLTVNNHDKSLYIILQETCTEIEVIKEYIEVQFYKRISNDFPDFLENIKPDSFQSNLAFIEELLY